jgi:hypothetical protein
MSKVIVSPVEVRLSRLRRTAQFVQAGSSISINGTAYLTCAKFAETFGTVPVTVTTPEPGLTVYPYTPLTRSEKVMFDSRKVVWALTDPSVSLSRVTVQFVSVGSPASVSTTGWVTGVKATDTVRVVPLNGATPDEWLEVYPLTRAPRNRYSLQPRIGPLKRWVEVKYGPPVPLGAERAMSYGSAHAASERRAGDL